MHAAAATSQTALIGSPRTVAITPKATAAVTATRNQTSFFRNFIPFSQIDEASHRRLVGGKPRQPHGGKYKPQSQNRLWRCSTVGRRQQAADQQQPRSGSNRSRPECPATRSRQRTKDN